MLHVFCFSSKFFAVGTRRIRKSAKQFYTSAITSPSGFMKSCITMLLDWMNKKCKQICEILLTDQILPLYLSQNGQLRQAIVLQRLRLRRRLQPRAMEYMMLMLRILIALLEKTVIFIDLTSFI